MSVDWGKAMRPTVHDLVEATNGNTDYIEDTLPGLLDGKADVTALPHIEHGRVSMSGTADAVRTMQVDFAEPFPTVPNVVTAFLAPTPKNGATSTSNITTTGFTLHLQYSTASTITVDWLAIG